MKAYVLPKRNFFSRGPWGSVSHALGVIEGLTDHAKGLTVIGGEGLVATLERAGLRHRVDPLELQAHPLAWRATLLQAVRTETTRDGVILIRYAPRAARALRAVSRERPVVLEVNSLLTQFGPGIRAAPLYARLDAFALRGISGVYAVSEFVASQIRPLVDVPIAVIPNAGPGVHRRPLPHATDPQSDPDEPVSVVYAGGLHTYYDFPAVVSAIEALRRTGHDLVFHVHGDGPALSTIIGLADTRPWVRVRGAYDGAMIEDLLPEVTQAIAILPPYAEGKSPIKLYDYISLGLPVVAPSTPETRTVLGGREPCGYLFSDRAAMATAFREALNDGPEGRLRRARTAQGRLVREHTWANRMQELVAWTKRL